jgi:hypothetical protein
MGGRTARRIAIALIALLVLLLVADRVGVVIAERAAGDTIQSSQHLTARPDVDIAGFPFLTQLATGDYDKITVTATDVPVGPARRLLIISRIRVVLHSLTVSRDFSSVRAKTADATALVSYAELGQTLDATISYAGDGQLAARKTVSIAGTSVTGTLRTHPKLVNGKLSFAGTTLNNAGALGAAAAGALNSVFDVGIPLQGIPFTVRLQSLRVTRNGLLIGLTGHDLAYHD